MIRWPANNGPFGLMPVGPFSNNTGAVGLAGTPGGLGGSGGGGSTFVPATFTVTTTVNVRSSFSANPGVLISGRRPDRVDLGKA
jgi:hypothetical protein